MSRSSTALSATVLVLLVGISPTVPIALGQCDWATVAGAPGADDDDFGAAVALGGDFAVVGAPGDDTEEPDAGAAYVFERFGHGWVQRAKLTAGADAVEGDRFGAAVALVGDTILVGAAETDLPGKTNAGAAYVFRRDGDAWPPVQRLTADDADALDRFGSAVAADSDPVYGDYAVVGAYLAGPLGDSPGAAYVFQRTGDEWLPDERLTALAGSTNDFFGRAAAIHLPFIIVGADGEDGTDGAAYVFVRGIESWSPQIRLFADDASPFANFGASVAIDFNHAVVGAPRDKNTCPDEDPVTPCGAAFVYQRTGPVWSGQARLAAGDTHQGQLFGKSVAIDVDTILVGAAEDNHAGGDSGAAYVFERTAGAWIERAKLTASDAAAADRFGWAAAVDGEYALVGAKDDDVGDNEDREGSAYLYRRGAGAWGWTAPSGGFDLIDFGNLQLCFTGEAPPSLSACCTPFDDAGDHDVDTDDLPPFAAELVGPSPP